MDFKGQRLLFIDSFAKQSCELIGCLYRLGFMITTINRSKLDIGYNTKYAAGKILDPLIADDLDYLGKLVLKEVKTGNYDVIMPITDATTDYITSHQDDFLPYVKIAAADRSVFIKAFDKQMTFMACERADVPSPLTRHDDEDVWQFAARCGYPLALKPRSSTGSMGFYEVDDEKRLHELIDSGKVLPDEYIIQKFINHSGRQFVTYMMMDENSEMKSGIVAEKLRWFPLDAGPGCFIGSCDRGDILDMSVRLLHELGWKGFAHVAFIEDPDDGLPKVLEINGRIPAGIRICRACGVNAVQQIMELTYGVPVTAMKAASKTQYLRQIHTDLLWFLRSPERFKAKPSWFSRRDTMDYIYDRRDRKPFFAYSWQCLTRYRTDMAKRKHV